MKVKIIKAFPDVRLNDTAGLRVGEVYEVVRVKEPDKFNSGLRYLIKIGHLLSINIPAEYVEIVE